MTGTPTSARAANRFDALDADRHTHRVFRLTSKRSPRDALCYGIDLYAIAIVKQGVYIVNYMHGDYVRWRFVASWGGGRCRRAGWTRGVGGRRIRPEGAKGEDASLRARRGPLKGVGHVGSVGKAVVRRCGREHYTGTLSMFTDVPIGSEGGSRLASRATAPRAPSTDPGTSRPQESSSGPPSSARSGHVGDHQATRKGLPRPGRSTGRSGESPLNGSRNSVEPSNPRSRQRFPKETHDDQAN